MRELFLSFNPKYFKPILYGLKKYEYRNRFCNEPTKCYLYLSQNVRKVVGILYLDAPLKLEIIRNDYILIPEVLERIDEYIASGVLNALPILKFIKFKTPITLEEIRNEIPGFMPPQMYFDLNNNLPLKRIVEKLEEDKLIVENHRDIIYLDNLCVGCDVMEQTEEFVLQNKKHKGFNIL